MGEFLMNAQGEDVVAGVRTPMPISKMADVMPGTTSNGRPFSSSSSPSSPPRPKTNGSPPLRRTTVLPSFALSTSSWLMSGCFIVWWLEALPT